MDITKCDKVDYKLQRVVRLQSATRLDYEVPWVLDYKVQQNG